MSTIFSPDRSKHHVPAIDEKLREWEAARNLQHSRRTAIYVSTPITTGPGFVEWMRTRGQHLKKDGNQYQRALKADVILPNIQRTAASIELLRWRHMGLIINPTTLDVPGWKQSDYHRFWTIVLDRHARRVILLQGWQYSRGCTIEFEAAQKLGIDCVDENLAAISRERYFSNPNCHRGVKSGKPKHGCARRNLQKVSAAGNTQGIG